MSYKVRRQLIYHSLSIVFFGRVAVERALVNKVSNVVMSVASVTSVSIILPFAVFNSTVIAVSGKVLYLKRSIMRELLWDAIFVVCGCSLVPCQVLLMLSL